ncbi:MAG: MMPL family transporter [Deltaproteobacteria bacterium]|nr:MMPL family transporter [Deltaproteobacteria bacterium]
MGLDAKRNLSDKISWYLTRKRVPALVAILAITAVFAYGAFQIRGEVILQEMLPYDHPYLKLQARFAEVFGSGGSTVAIALVQKNGDIFNPKTLTKLKKMTEQVEMADEVYRLLTVSIASNLSKVVHTKAKGEISIEALMYPDVPQTREGLDSLKKNVFSNPAYNGTLVAENGKAALLLTEFKENISYLRAFNMLRGIVQQYSDGETSVHVVGYPMLMGWVFSLKSQMFMVFGVSLAAIALVLWLIFTNVPGAISPLAATLILTIWGLGFIGFTGINFNPLLYVLAFLVGSRIIGNSHQIAYRYFEELNASGGDRTKACYETMRTMFIPNFTAVVSDAAGFTVLFVAKIALMQHLAIIMTFWMMTILLTGFLVPAICSLIPLEVASGEWAKESCHLDRKARLFMALTSFSIGPRTKYVMGTMLGVLIAFCAWEMTKLKIGDPTPGSPLFYSSHPYNKDTAVVDGLFNASSENLALFYEGAPQSVYEPAVLQTFDDFQEYMAVRLPDIYKSSSSVGNMAKMVNVMLHDGDPAYHQLPSEEEQLTAVVGYVRRVTGATALQRFLDADLERSQIQLYFSDHTSDNLERIRDAAYGFFKDHPMKTGSGEFKLAGGRIGMEIAVNEEMRRTHALIDALIYTGMILLCSFMFRSFVAGLMLTVPLMIANVMVAAYMSLNGMGLSINTLPIAAIGAGIGADFAIYLYSRAMEEFPVHRSWGATITQSICTCGKAVFYTGVTIVLPILTWYFLSDMKFQAQVGFFLSMIMGINVLFCFTLHPLMIYLIKPKFITRGVVALNESRCRGAGLESVVAAEEA